MVMKIINKDTQEILYNTVGDEVYPVTQAFWDNLKAGRARYLDGGTIPNGTQYSMEMLLKLEDPDFERLLDSIYHTGRGKAVMTGEIPSDVVM
jgi:hypothetical protein